MDPQHTLILALFLILACLIFAVFTYVYRSSVLANRAQKASNNQQQGLQRPNRKRFFLFLILAVTLIILLSVTVQKVPYYYFADEEPDKVVFVAARMFTYTMSSQAIKAGEIPPYEEIILPADKPVEFRVTSLDVTHGFAIYDDQDQLIAQTQAMPGYVNRLRWKFEKPGEYRILCLEFCGLAHAFMVGTFTVQ